MNLTMLLRSFTAFIMICVGASVSAAGLTEERAIELASASVIDLTTRDFGYGIGQLPGSWRSVPAEEVFVFSEGRDHVVVRFGNASANQTLFVKLSNNGRLLGASFSGEF